MRLELVDPGALTPLAIEREGRGEFRVASPVVWIVGETRIEIPAGYVTDGASLPWFARWLWSPWGRAGAAAILHDWILENTGDDWPKWLCDWLFLGALKAQGLPDLTAVCMYLAVRTKPKPARVSRMVAAQ